MIDVLLFGLGALVLGLMVGYRFLPPRLEKCECGRYKLRVCPARLVQAELKMRKAGVILEDDWQHSRVVH